VVVGTDMPARAEAGAEVEAEVEAGESREGEAGVPKTGAPAGVGVGAAPAAPALHKQALKMKVSAAWCCFGVLLAVKRNCP
jgi:hypothetical protein